MKEYCNPWEAGLASEASAVARGLGRILTVLENEINHNLVQGAIVDYVRRFRIDLHNKLKANGWIIEAKQNGWKVLQPLKKE
jgi:hypothetical protein